MSGFFGLPAGAPRAMVRREGGTTWDFVLFARIGAHGEKSGSEAFRDSIEPGPGTCAMMIGVLRRAIARALDRCDLGGSKLPETG